MKKQSHILLKWILLAGIIQMFVSHVYAQQTVAGALAQPPKKANEWEYKASPVTKIPEFWRISNPNQAPTVEQFIPWLKQTFNIDPNIDFFIISSDHDNEGWTRYRYGQTFKGIPLDGAMYIINVKNGKVVSMTGQVLDRVKVPSIPIVIADDAAALALAYVKGTYLTNEEYKDSLPMISGKPKLSYNFVSNDFEGELKLTYRCRIVVDYLPLERDIYVNALNGSIENDLSLIMKADTAGGGNTKYSGNKVFTVNKLAAGRFELKDNGRHCVTFNLRNRTKADTAAATAFTSTTAVYNYTGARDTDRYALDMQFAAEKWYDYFHTRFGRNSIDDAGYLVKAYIHFKSREANAYWSNSLVLIGDGKGSTGVAASNCAGTSVPNKPYTELDLAAHEITHGMTQFTGRLIYAGEPGFLNEGFSDLFGETVQWYADPAQLDWLFAPHTSSNVPDRRYDTPQTGCLPNTYLGRYWRKGAADAGGVHYNSTVLSHWFYLLSRGKNTGTNDNGYPVRVDSIGIDSAAYAAYYTLLNLTPMSKFNNARYTCIQQIIDRRGVCNRMMRSVLNAWDAVGVYGSNPVVESNHSRPSMFKGDTAVLSASPDRGIDYTWTPASSLSSSSGEEVKAFPNKTTTYTVTATCAGLEFKDSLTVVILPKIFKDSIKPDTICYHDTTLARILVDSARLGDSIPYVVNRIAYNPVSWATDNLALTGTNARSAAIAMPFFFPFFKDTFNQVYMTTNGYAGFNLPAAALNTGSIPNAAAPFNIIALAWKSMSTNITFSSGVKSFSNGFATEVLTDPDRLVIQMNDVCNPTEPHRSVTGQIVMYKSGDIDLILMHSDTATQTEGIKNSDGRKGYVANGRNNNSWAAVREAYRFSPTTSKRLRYKWSVANYHCLPQAGLKTPDSAKTKYSPWDCDAPNKYNTIKLVCQVYDSLFKWTKYDTVKVVVVRPQAHIFGTFHACKGDTVKLCTDTSSCRFKWSTGDSTNMCIKIVPDSNTKVWIIGRCWKCADTDSVKIRVDKKPNVSSIKGTDSICNGMNDTIMISNSGAGSLSWQPRGSTDSIIVVSPTTTTTYQVIATNGYCSDTGKFTVNIKPKAATTVTGDTAICLGKSATLTASGAASYTWQPGGMTGSSITVSPTVTTTYTVTGTNNNKCGDSTATIKVRVKKPTDSTFNITICKGRTYTLNGKTYDSTGTYHDTLTNKAGCDSTITLNLNVNGTVSTMIYDTICVGNHIVFGGKVINMSGIYMDTIKATAHCDSVITLNLTVDSIVHSYLTTKLCMGGLIFFHNRSIHMPGVYTDTIFTAAGCDSVVRLTVLPMLPPDTVVYAYSCVGKSYTYNGRTFTRDTVVTDTFRTAGGCDSIVHLNLIFNGPYYGYVVAYICGSNTFIYNGKTYTTDGTYYDTLMTSQGCDSIVTIYVYQNVPSYGYVYGTICPGHPFTYNGITYYADSVYTDTLKTSGGCDSIVYIYVYPGSPSYGYVYASVCEGKSYTYNGKMYTLAGTYYDTLMAQSGCDSIVSIYLTVTTPSYGYVYGSLCDGHSYTFNGKTYTTDGTYYDTLKTSNGCDSILTIILSPGSPTYGYVYPTICNGYSYAFNGHSYSTGGIYYDTVSTSGCDSIMIIDLTVTIPVVNNIYVTICNGSSYAFGGQILTTSGIYTDTISNTNVIADAKTFKDTSIGVKFLTSTSNGCDTVNILHLTVSSGTSSSVYASICSGSAYYFNSKYYYSAGTYSDTIVTGSGCDSIITLYLTMSDTVHTYVYASICYGGSYYFNGNYYSSAGTYTATYTNSHGCDSSVTLYLTVYNATYSYTYASICNGGSYYFNGTSYSSAGTYYAYLTNSHGCDSTVTLYLSVSSKVYGYVYATICDGGSYYFNGSYYNTAGTYYAYLTNGSGCDSTVTLYLTVNSVLTGTVFATICHGGSYYFNGSYYSTAGTYYANLTNSNGCDSTVTLYLSVNSPLTGTVYASICNGGSYYYNGSYYSTAGTYYAYLTNSTGCDSTVTLFLTVNSTLTGTAYASICSGGSYYYNGNYYYSAGSYTVYLTNKNGCDSTVTLYLTVNNSSNGYVYASICDGGSYSFNGSSYSSAGTYYAYLTNSNGCDSTVTLYLTVNSSTNGYVYASICNSGSYSFNGSSYSSAGTYYAYLTNSNGCDSTVTLYLTVNSSTNGYVYASICNGSSYSFNGSSYSSAGTYYAYLTNSNGCDSTVTLYLTVNSSSNGYVYASICNGGSYSFNGSSYSSAGTYYAYLTNSNGCDSTVTLHLTVYNTSSSTVNASICSGHSYSFNGSSYTTAGTYSVTLTNSHGCDSTVTLHLTVYNTSSSTVNASICSGHSYSFNGSSYTTAGTYSATLTNSHGCDSTVTLHLTVYNTSSSTVNASICSGHSYSFNGSSYTTAGTYSATLSNSHGCDSTVTLHLTVYNTSSSTVNASICSGHSYSFNGSSYTVAGAYSATLTNSHGCDSTVTLHLTVNNTSSSTVNASICSGHSYSFNGSSYTTAGTYTATLTNSHGCDSTVTLHLTVNNTSSSTVNASICSGHSYSFNGSSYTTAGTYTATLTNSHGCDSTVTLHLTVNNTSSSTVNASICSGHSYSFNGSSYTTAGTYTATLTNSHGCDSTITLHLTVKPTSSSTVSASICSGSSYTFNGNSYTTSGTYTATLTNSRGCDSTVTLYLTVKPTSSSTISATICSGSSYTFNGTSYSSSGTYTAHYTNKQGCDSAVTLNLTVTPKATPTISISASPGTSFVMGTNVTFTASTSNGGSTPSYQWKKNGINVGTNSNTYSDSLLLTKDTIYCVLTSNATCITTTTVNSNKLGINLITSCGPITLTMSSGSGGSLVFHWTPRTGSYKLYYTTMQSLNSPSVVSTVYNSYTITTPNPGNTFFAYVVDQGCSNTQSNNAYYNTSGGSCTATAPTTPVAAPSITSAALSWTGSASNYVVFYQKVGSTGGWLSSTTSSASYTISGLTASTCYAAYVINKCSSSYGYSSRIDTFCTAANCSAPSTLTLSAVNCHGFTATWTAVSGVSQYEIYITRTTGSGAPSTSGYRSNTNSYTYTMASSGTGYSVYIKSWCNSTTLSPTSSNTATTTTLTTGCKTDGSTLLPAADLSPTGTFRVYPNPNSGLFSVELYAPDMGTVNGRLILTDAIGRSIITTDVTIDNGYLKYNTDLHNQLASGVYILTLISGDKQYNQRVVVSDK